MYTGTCEVDTRKLKEVEAPPCSEVRVCVVEASRVSHSMRNRAMVSSSAGSLLKGMAMTMLTVTVLPTAMAVLVEEKLVLGVGVPPAAVIEMEGLGVLLGLGRLVMDSLG